MPRASSSGFSAHALRDPRKDRRAIDATRQTFESAFFYVLRDVAREHAIARLGTDKYHYDPVGFVHDVLGMRTWDFQDRFLGAVRDHARVAVRSGHKVAKSTTAACAALWLYTRPGARVHFTAPTMRQVQQVLYREMRMRKRDSGLCVGCRAHNTDCDPRDKVIAPCVHSAVIDGYTSEMAGNGIIADDFREIRGFTANTAEAVAGISGSGLTYFVDEASGVDARTIEALEGNRASGGRIVFMGNPTRSMGDFYDAFHTKKHLYFCMHVSSEETPNVIYGQDDPRAIDGLATRAWVEEKKREWGEESALYRIRVKGEFVSEDDSRVFTVATIGAAEQRWNESPEEDEGRLFIGLDAAGMGDDSDEIVWCFRRGFRVDSFVAMRALSVEAIIMHTTGLAKKHAEEREVPVLVFDREGKLGAELMGALQAYVAEQERQGMPRPFDLIPVRASDRAHRSPTVYDRMRDELIGNLFDWFQMGGAIPEDVKLAAELSSIQWMHHQTGRIKITAKKDIRKLLQRSPDRMDALALAVWESASVAKTGRSGEVRPEEDEEMYDPDAPIDPYAYRQ